MTFQPNTANTVDAAAAANTADAAAESQAAFPLSRDETHRLLEKRHGIQTQKAFDNAVVGIAGLGGLGSHIAVSLARLGIGRLILADFDTVEATNLHRQHYIGADIGTPKAWALTRQLQAINPYLTYEPHVVRITPDQVKPLFEPCTIIIEAFDDAETKAWFTQTCLTELTPRYPYWRIRHGRIRKCKHHYHDTPFCSFLSLWRWGKRRYNPHKPDRSSCQRMCPATWQPQPCVSF